jgi:hypothetical protein
VCRLLPEKKRLKEEAANVLDMLNNGGNVDVGLALVVIPQAWRLISDLYQDKLAIMSELAGARLQLGDLSKPGQWNPQDFPGVLCAE